ncbi:hypothetical protein [Ureaplasma zalophigenitalium]|uniref:Uncharacterized protein n=1 Tax=Ureaplasma zalophigenitalium TaxID=907723 RepID=A0ABT3BPP4_9BACT|nr:hypothetical protein [Ureaplasma zalophigenitalium]MCV3754174.1 hypothetical protein [Ureaplasma zalophigenitalium]
MKPTDKFVSDEIATDDILLDLQNHENKIKRKRQSLRWWQKMIIVLSLIIGCCLCITLLVALIVHLQTGALF